MGDESQVLVRSWSRVDCECRGPKRQSLLHLLSFVLVHVVAVVLSLDELTYP